MNKAKLLTTTARLADIVLAGGGFVCLLALSYFVYYYAWTGQRQFTSPVGVAMYYAFPAVLAILLLASLRLKSVYQIILAVHFVSLTALLYGAELLLRLSGSTLSELNKPLWAIDGASKEEKQKAKVLAKTFGIDFDTRDRHEVIADLRKQGIDAVPLLWETPLVWETAINTAVMPIGGISNKMTVVCNQNGKYLTYTSDEHGFHNPGGIWQADSVNIAAVGNSFTLGYCVPSDKSFIGLIRRRYPATLNLGMVGEGPLHILATLKEYALFLKPKLVLWFYSEADTFMELQEEKQSHILMSYLGDDFTQGLLARQSEIDQALTGDIDRQTALEISRQAKRQEYSGNVIYKLQAFIKLSSLRQKLGVVYGTARQEPQALSESEVDMNLFRDILSEAEARVSAWGGKLYFVYLPCWERYAKNPVIGVKARLRVLAVVTNLGIPLIDTDSAFQAHSDPLSLFPFRGPGHYNEEGHRVVAETVLNVISHHLPNGSNPRPSSDLVAWVN